MNLILVKKFKFKVYLGKVLINKYDLYNLKVFDFNEIWNEIIIRIKIVEFL